jgi:hypothetical protein
MNMNMNIHIKWFKSTLLLNRMQVMLKLALIAHLLLVFIEGKCMIDRLYYEGCQEGVATPCLQVICMMVSKIPFIILLGASGVWYFFKTLFWKYFSMSTFEWITLDSFIPFLTLFFWGVSLSFWGGVKIVFIFWKDHFFFFSLSFFFLIKIFIFISKDGDRLVLSKSYQRLNR